MTTADKKVAMMVDNLAGLTVVQMVVKKAVMKVDKKVGMLGMKWVHLKVEQLVVKKVEAMVETMVGMKVGV